MAETTTTETTTTETTTASVPTGGERPELAGRLRIGFRRWRLTLERLQKKLVRDRVSLSAGSLAYHWFLALFPAVVALLGLVTLLHLRGHLLTRLINGIDRALPAGAARVLDEAVKAASTRSSGSAAALVVGVVVALWSASSGVAALEQALDVAYEVPVDRTFLARRVRAVPIMVALLLLGGASAALVVFGSPIGSATESHFPIRGVVFLVVWDAIRWIGAVLLMMLLFSVLYFLGPNKERPRWQWVSAGGVVATAVFLLASLGFSYYVSAFGSYGATYGSFAGVAILIFWLYLTGFAILVGGELNAELERRAAAPAAQPALGTTRTAVP